MQTMKFLSNTLFKSLLLATLLMGGVAAQAQYRFGGLLMDRDGMMSNDMYTLSQTNFGFGTARSMSMAGAFTSLGGDVASMSINPAGLGMYRSGDLSFSPMMAFNNATTDGSDAWGENSMSRFSIANFGAVFNLYESSRGSLVSFNVGLGYNRVADLNYNYGFTSQSAPSTNPYRSINDAFVRQLGQGGVFPAADGSLDYSFGDSYYWGGMLAYNGYLLDVETDEYGDYWTSANRIGSNAAVGHTAGVESRGYIGEYQLSGGLNFANKLYVGATIGIQSVRWERQIYYGEDYIYSSTPVYSDGTPLSSPAEWMDYNQAVRINGAGVNLKLGAIYRPFPSLRLGVALHTPTYYSLERTYQSYMASNFNTSGDTTPSLEDVGDNSWEFCSPTKLMFGASYSFGRFAVLSVDYERDWYNGIRVKNIPAGFDLTKSDYRQEFKDNFKGSNIVRLGAEIKPIANFALRAGYGYSDGALRNEYSAYYNRPLTFRTVCYSAGAGVALGRATIDLAYQHLVQSQTAYMLYYAMDEAGYLDTASPYYTTSLTRDYVILTLGYKF